MFRGEKSVLQESELFSTTIPKTHFSLCLRGREAISNFITPLKISQITELFVYNQHFIPPSISQKILQSQIIENTEKNPDLENSAANMSSFFNMSYNFHGRMPSLNA